MKRQVIGIRRSSDELEDASTNDSKRIKLLKNDTDNGNLEVKCVPAEAKDSSPSKSSQNHNHEDQMPIISQNGSIEHNISNNLPPQENEHNEQSSNVNGNRSIADSKAHELLNINHNGSCDEVVVKVPSPDSGVSSELHRSDSRSNSVANSEETQPSGATKSMPVLMSYGELDGHNGESTDSFQSEGFEAMKNSNESEHKDLKPSSSRESDKSSEKESSGTSHEVSVDNNHEVKLVANSEEIESGVKSDVSKNFDLDNLTLSHLEVTQFEGHTDVIFSVAADDDIVLSSSGDTTVKVWNMVEKKLISNFSGHSDSVTSLLLLSQSQSDLLKKKLQCSEVSRIAITGSLDCHIKLWSVFEGHELASIYTFNGITCLGYLETESYVVVGTEGGKLELWDLVTSKVVQSVRAHEDSVSDIKVVDCNIYSVSTDGTVKIWLFEDEDIYPVYTRKRKEKSSKENSLGPALWKTVAVSDNLLYLGDSTNAIKVLDSRAGRLRLFRNQLEEEGLCECVAVEKDILLTSFYDASSDTGGVNVWRLPEMSYVCTLSGEIQDVCCMTVVRKGNHLRIVTGGHQLFLWEFDLTRAPDKESQDPFHAVELEQVGHEIAENVVEVKTPDSKKSFASYPNESNSNKWCNVM